MDRKQFTFYESFASALGRIKSKAARCDAYDAICQYALYGTEPDMDSLPDAAAIAFDLIRPTLATSRRKSENGIKGGSAKQTESKPEAKKKQSANYKEIEVEKEIEIENDMLLARAPARRFTPPTLDEVKAYCRERGNHVDADRFVSFYTSNGWKVGKNPMKDWKAAVRTWERDDKPQAKKKFDGASWGEESKEAKEKGIERMRKLAESLGVTT